MSLKERIAALQERERAERSTSPPLRDTHAHAVAPQPTGAGALRDKIAHFKSLETKGGVPAPRGSFGLGAPPESAPKKRAELYGNMMQPARIPSATLARPVSPFTALEEDYHNLPANTHDPDRARSPSLGFLQSQHTGGALHAQHTGGLHAQHTGGGLHAQRTGDDPSPPPRKQTVQSRGTAFSTALDIARKAEADVKAERRKSALWMQPQLTGGGGLQPQYTGGSGLTPQYTGGLTPQYTGSGALTPQHTGGSALTSPPLSPLAPYSPIRRDSFSGSRRDSFSGSRRESGSFSPGQSSPTLNGSGSFSPPHVRSPTLSFGASSAPFFPREVVDEPEGALELRVPGSGDVHVDIEEGQVDREKEQEERIPSSSDAPRSPGSPESSHARLDEDLQALAGLRPSADAPVAAHLDSDPHGTNTETETEVNAEERERTRRDAEDAVAHPSRPSSVQLVHLEIEHAEDDGDDNHSYIDAYLDRSPVPSHAQLEGEGEGPYGETENLDDEDGRRQEDVDEQEQEDDEPDPAPLPNSFSTHAFRAHLSTITERSAEPGSPAWDARFSVDGGGSRSSVNGYGYSAGEGGTHRGDGGREDARRRLSGRYSRFSMGESVDEDIREVEEEDGEVVAGMAGVGAGRFMQLDTGAVVRQITTDDAHAQARGDASSPSPYRMSGYTERGYTPSLRSESEGGREGGEGASERGSVYSEVGLAYAASAGSEGGSSRAGGEDEKYEQRVDGREMEAETPGVSEPPTPHAHTEVDPRTPTVEKPDGLALPVPGPESHQDSLISGTISQGDSLAAPSQRDSFLSVSNSQRDSLLSVSNSQRDSLSSTHTQTLLLHGRPLSALTIDSGSPSHVALAHRVPVAVTDITGVGRGRAVFVPGRDTSPRIPSDGEGFPPSPEEEQTQRDVDAHIQAPAPPTQRRPLPSARAQRPGTTYTPEPVTPPRRHAYTTGAPRPYTAYVPPADEDEDGVGEFGTVSFGGGQPRSFTAVVHGRVREGGSGWDSGNTKWDAGTSNGWDGREREREEKRLPLPPMPLSPGFASGELAELLAQAASLEQRLEKGELPGEALRRMSMRPGPSNASASQAPPPAVPPIPTPAGATVKSQRSFRNPLTRSRSERRPKAQRDREEGHPVASSSMGNLLAMQIAPSAHADPLPPSLGWSKSSTQLVPLEVIPLSPTNSDVPPTPPPKSPGFGGGTRYFSSLRRLASTTRALNSPGAPGARGSVSTSSELSSEDSMGLATPPDDAAAVNPATGSAVTWPSLSSKKSVGSIGRGAATLAGKMWHRTRSKSSTSTVSSIEASPPPPLPIPALPSPPVLKLDQTPFIIPPIQTSLYGQDSSETPTNRTPNGGPHSALSSATPTASKPTQLPKSKSYTAPTRPPHLTLNSSASSPGALLPVPNTAPESRPISWTSVSSGGSSSVATSPMFDKAIFDAFPSVPEMPLPQSHSARVGSYGHANSVHSSGMNSPAAPVRPLPLSPPGFNSDSSTSTPTFSDRSFTRGGTPGTYDNQPLLARVGETQRRVDTLL